MTTGALVVPTSRPAAALLSPRVLYGGLWSLLGLMCALFLARVPDSVLLAIGALFVPAGLALALRDRVRALAFMPALALLGPMASVSLGSAGVHLGDIYLGVLLLAPLVAGSGHSRIWLGPYPLWLLLGLALALASALFSLDRTASLVGIWAIAEIAAVYLLALNWLHDAADAAVQLRGLVGAVALSCILTLASFSRGEPLLIGSDPALAASIRSSGTYYAATFFTTGFIFPLAATAVVAAVLLGREGKRALETALYVFMIFIGLLTELLMDAKTALVGTIAVLGMVLLRLLMQRRTRGRALPIALGVVLLAGLAFRRVQQVLPEAQLLALYGRLSSAESLRNRFIIWENVIDYLAQSPRTLLLGIGPEVSVRARDLPLFRILYYPLTTVGDVDSSYLYLLLNYGLPILLLFLAVLLITLLRLGRILRGRSAEAEFAVWAALGVWLIMGISQQSALTRTVFVFAQLLALAQLLPRWHAASRSTPRGGGA